MLFLFVDFDWNKVQQYIWFYEYYIFMKIILIYNKIKDIQHEHWTNFIKEHLFKKGHAVELDLNKNKTKNEQEEK